MINHQLSKRLILKGFGILVLEIDGIDLIEQMTRKTALYKRSLDNFKNL